MPEKQVKVVQKEPKEKEKEKPKEKRTLILVKTPVLNIRSGPGFEHPSKGFIPVGQHEVTEIKDGFGKLADETGWVYLPCTEPVKEG